MSHSLYAASVGTFRHMLGALDRLLSQAEASAQSRGFDAAVLLTARLAPYMFPLPRQVQIACDMAKSAGARLAGVDVPKHDDTETTFAELHARIAKVLAFLDTLDAAAIDGAADRPVTLTVQGNEMRFTGSDYLNTWALPNFYFHMTTTYALLRMQGVPLGKRDYLG